MEKGEPSVALGIYATVLFVLGVVDRLADLIDVRTDTVGLELQEEDLPQRIRRPRRPKGDAFGQAGSPVMDPETLVHVDIDGVPILVGRLWTRTRRNRESATFEYDRKWLYDPAGAFSLEPALQLGPGPVPHASGSSSCSAHSATPAADRWRRALMRRAERRLGAERARETPRTLREIDYPPTVDDEARQGALRFAREEGGPFLAEHHANRIPPLIELSRLLSAAEHVVADSDSDEDLRLLLAPGSSSGGARPEGLAS
ncbi:MAG: hypothetical protein U5R48_18580 [Gammaproteobacteria bacterium]|nr:hypothetical protein [Gammaproteobacteria bacterium]